MFFPQLNVPEIPSALNIEDKTKLDISELNAEATTFTLEQYRASEIGKQNILKSNSEKSPVSGNTNEEKNDSNDIKNQTINKGMEVAGNFINNTVEKIKDK
jgi:hypothetical protein